MHLRRDEKSRKKLQEYHVSLTGRMQLFIINKYDIFPSKKYDIFDTFPDFLASER
jgi:hypothetical protein